MATHVEQHYVPRFLLEQWHSGADQKLCSMRWAHKKLDAQRYKAKSVARMAHLYSYLNLQGEHDVRIERDFLGPHIDEPAAEVHRLLLATGLKPLSDEQHTAWTYFLVSLLIRTPEMVDRLRTVGKASLTEQLERDPEDFNAVRGGAPETSLLQWFNAREPNFLDSFGIKTMPDLIRMELFTKRFIGGKTWVLRGVSGAKHSLLIGDRPLLQGGDLNGDHLFALPIAPGLLFAVASGPEVAREVTEMPIGELVQRVNDQTVKQAHTWVYGVDDSQMRFLSNRLALRR